MDKHTVPTRARWLATLALIVVALVVAACGAPSEAPAAADAPAAEAPATGADEAEATAVPEEEGDDQAVVKEVVEQSDAAQSQMAEGGITVTSDEDVTTPRDQLGGEYRSTSTSDIVNFHPYLTTDSASSGAQANVYDAGLLRLDENTLQYIPNMAESYSVSEDGLTYTFKLRENITWSDGAPLTANDFAWAYEQAIKPENEFPYVSQLEFITSYKALDDYTLEIQIDEVYCPALGQMSGLITPLPKHIWETLDWKDPEKNPEINSPSVTSGPYRLEEWKRDQFTTYTANEDYWYRGAPNITRQVSEIVPDQDVSYQKLKSGEADTGTITPENLAEARTLENITVYEWWPAAAQWSYIGLNMREGYVTNDINVRHGIAYALDKDLMTEEIMEGQAQRQCSIYPSTSWAYNPDVPCYDFDPDQAIAAFEEAGYTFDGSQMLTPEGEPLTLKLIYGPNTNKTRELMAVTVQDQLAQIGVNVEIQGLEWASFLEATDSDEPDWDMFIGGWRATIEPHIMYTIWAEENIPQLNSVAYVNKDVEALFKEAGANCDPEFRKEKYGEIQRIIAEEMPYVFLWNQKTWSGQNNRIGGIDPKPLGIGWNSNDWYIREDAGQ
jgi:peptide/nickel transport system substrate-binding protein